MEPLTLGLTCLNAGISLYGQYEASKAASQQAADYQVQAEINRQIGLFNAEVAEMTGQAAVSAIAEQTKKIMGQQRVAFARSGVEMVGDPNFVLGNTYYMGQQKAQEAYFNAQVQKINALHNSQNAVSANKSASSQATYQALSNTISIFDTITDTVKSISSLSKLNSPTMAAPPNIFNLEAHAENIGAGGGIP